MENVNGTPVIEVRKRVWNYKVETLDKMKVLRDTLGISMPEVIDLAIENLMVETGLYETYPELGNRTSDIDLGAPIEFFTPDTDFLK